MAQPKFYYDPKTGILYVENQDNIIPVVTSASLDPTACGLSTEGVLMLKDFEGNWRAMADPETNESISLIGPKGELGILGEPGLNGLDGANGLTPNMTISEEGIATIEYVKDFISPDAPMVVNLKGPKGDSGLTPDIKLDDQGNLSVEYKVLTDTPTSIQMNIKGEPGQTAIPNLDEDGNLSWTIGDTSNIPSPMNIRGPLGLQGPLGDKGDQGLQGELGLQGIAGVTPNVSIDAAGKLSIEYAEGFTPTFGVVTADLMGPKGADGKTFIPTVSDAGVISWSNDGDLENPNSVSILGPEGPLGPQGEKGLGLEDSFPTNPKLGDTFIWGGDSVLNDECFLGYVMTGQQYTYSQLPASIGLDLSTTTSCLIPMHIMMYVPSLLGKSIFVRKSTVEPLAFDNDGDLLIIPTDTSTSPSLSSMKMSWDVCWGIDDAAIKALLPYIINISKSVFDGQAIEVTPAGYSGIYTLSSYLQGGALKCTYQDLISEESNIITQFYQKIQSSNSDIFNGILTAIELQAEESGDITTYNTDIYLIPIQAVQSDSYLTEGWTTTLGASTMGWVPTSSALHNGFNTNLIGDVLITVTPEEGEMEIE